MRPLAALLVLAAAPAAAGEKLSLDDALARALAESPRVAAAKARAEAALDSERSLRGRLLPSVHVSDEAQHYDKEFAVTFSLPMPPGTPAPSFVAREQDTNTFVAAAGQPVLGLLHLWQDYRALGDQADAAGEEVRAAQADVKEEVRTQYLRLFEARALGDLARASAKQLAEQLEVMGSKVKAGVATNADVLRVKVAAANARQQELQATAQESVARTTLLDALGLPFDAQVELEEPTLSDRAAVTEVKAALELAEKHRPEVASAGLQAGAAEKRATGKLFGMLPELNLEAGYTHINGQAFAPPDQSFVGVKLDWAVWEWGAHFYEARAARAQAEAARRQEESARRRIGTEVAARLAQLDASGAAVEVARATIDSAEEAYRVTEALLKAGSATTTDLLDAQSALTQARLNLVRARYQLALARVGYDKAVGAL